MTRAAWIHLLNILAGLFLALAIGAAIVLLVFGIGGFPPQTSPKPGHKSSTIPPKHDRSIPVAFSVAYTQLAWNHPY